jgi:hypothetical protein
MESRTKDSYQKFLFEFIKLDILVCCPACSKKAIVKSGDFEFGNSEEGDLKVICLHCGFNKKLTDKSDSDINAANGKSGGRRHYVIGAAVDPFFGLPLWLKTDFEKYTLWAYNFEHLEFLYHHIGAKLRERNGQALFNSSLGSRLPGWMTLKKHRAALLKKIEALKDK